MHSLFCNPTKNQIFIIADLGLTCGGNIERSIELIQTAAKIGVDAVKFQMISAEELLGDKTVEYTYPTITKGNVTENMYEMFLNLEFSDKEWDTIKKTCHKNQIGLIVTCHVESAVERINRLELPVNKICTWSLSHYRMISKLAKNGKPLIIDTGTINLAELEELESFYKKEGGSEIIILYDFHTNDPTEMNFNAIKHLKSLGYKIGYTPQGRRDWLDYMSIGLGVTFLEKRLTLSREIAENGHWKAHNPNEFKVWIDNVNECSLALGHSQLRGTKQDLQDSKKYYKSAWLLKDVKEGETITTDHFEFKRPGTGVSSKQIIQSYEGKVFEKDFTQGELFNENNIYTLN